MAAFQVQPPEKFTFKPEDWSKWIRRFERFRIASGLEEKSKESQVNTLIYSMGSEADDIVQSLGLTADDQKKYDEVKKRLEDFFIVKRNVIFERAKFNLRSQEENEAVDVFITDLYNLAEHCNFGVLREELIRDRIVVGIRDKALSGKLQLEADLTLEKAMNFARQKETVRKQQIVLRGDSKQHIDIVGVGKHGKIKKNLFNSSSHNERHSTDERQKNQRDKTKAEKCDRCLGPKHFKKNCPAKDSRCHKCGKNGHWQRACRSKQVNEVTGEIFPNDLFLGEIIVESIETEPWKANLEVNECKFHFKLDSGADVTVVPKGVYDKISSKRSLELLPTNKTLLGPCKYRLNCLGKFNAKITSKNKSIIEEIYVIRDLSTPLLSKSACVSLNLLSKICEVENFETTQCEYKQRIIHQYPKLLEGLGELEGEYEIKLKELPEPYALNVPRKVPFPLLDKTKQEIDRMLKTGVISPVDQPTAWCAPMVVTPKPNGDVRICVDLTKLNKSVLREAYPLPTVDFTLAKLSRAKVFSKIDANSAFWQRKLSESSRLLTTFITPWGRFCFNRLPYGISTGSEQFQKCMNNILKGLEGVECKIDDLLVHGESQEQHDLRLHAVLKRLEESNLTLNKSKCLFSVPSVKALGQVISAEGVSPDPDKVKAIINIPAPKNVAEVRSFMGMVNQFNKFTSHLATKSKPLRDLLRKDSVWLWGESQNKAFSELKICLTSAPILALYDPNKEIKINADALSYGIGGVVLQKQEDGEWKPVSYISRALTDTESRYSQIEKECLAFTWACERSSDYILGKPFIGETDHKPLVPLLTTHTIDQIPPRIQRFRMRLMRFNLQRMIHVPGKQMYTSDALSRLVRKPADSDVSLIPNIEMNAFIGTVIDSLPVSDTKLKEIIEAQENDEVCKRVKQYCLEGWPEKHAVPDAIRPYWRERGELTVVQKLVMKGMRILIPSNLQLDVLDKIHQGHLGITKCQERAKQSVWWPGLSTQIQDMVQSCRICANYLVNKPEPLLPYSFPERPWQTLAADFFKCENIDYLLVVDYFSRYVEVCAMQKNKTVTEVCRVMKEIFSRFGILEKIKSDNGPPFNSGEYLQFANEWGFQVAHSSPKYPQANGEVERAVQTVKRLLKKEKDKALLAYRSTPLSCGYSPAELLMGRKIRTMVPVFHSLLTPKWPNLAQLQEQEAQSRAQQEKYFNTRHRAMPLQKLSPGTEVRITTHPEPGVIKNDTESTRQYEVQTPTGVIKRNRVHLVPLPQETSNEQTFKDPKTPELNIHSRPKRTLKLSLKARESKGLA